ncbi:MAG: hypothetical protein IPO67_27540 [Deltaproteobacteria bacterium]|nr:hypothetical protein [Deltaproteobacteria bacterium]
MDRRDFLGGMSAIFAAGLMADEAEAAGPPPTAPHEVEPWLATLDQDLQRMSQKAPTDGVSEALDEAGLPPTLMGETFATLSLFAAWRDSDEEVRQHPAFQARLFSAAEAHARRVVGMADWMEGVNRQRRREIGALLARPNRLMAVLDHVLIRKGERMNPARRRALRGTLGDLARATRRAGARPEALVDELILAVDHAAREEGVDRHAVAGGLAQRRGPSADGATSTQTQMTAELEGEPPPSPEGESPPSPEDKLVRLGLRLLKLGVLLEVSGPLVYYAGILLTNTGILPVLFGITAPLCFVVGPLLLLTGLVVLIVGKVRRRRAQLEAEDDELTRLLAPVFEDADDDTLAPAGAGG